MNTSTKLKIGLVRGRPKDWNPSVLERKCLRDLDGEDSWPEILHEMRPDESEVQPWRPFRRIFYFNLFVFLPVTALAFLFVEFGSGAPDLRGDALAGAICVLTATLLFSGYVTHLYRRSWNRRASFLNLADQDDD